MDLILSKLTDLTGLHIDYTKFKDGSFYKKIIEDGLTGEQNYFAVRDENNKILLIYKIQNDTENDMLVILNLNIHDDAPKYEVIKELFNTLSVLYPTYSISVLCKDTDMMEHYRKLGFVNKGYNSASIQSFMKRRQIYLR